MNNKIDLKYYYDLYYYIDEYIDLLNKTRRQYITQGRRAPRGVNIFIGKRKGRYYYPSDYNSRMNRKITQFGKDTAPTRKGEKFHDNIRFHFAKLGYSPAEINASIKWKGNGYVPIQTLMRYDAGLIKDSDFLPETIPIFEKEWRNVVKSLKHMLDRSYLSENSIVWRGCDQIDARILKTLNIGDTYISHIPFATSFIKNLASLFIQGDEDDDRYVMEIHVDKSQKGIMYHDKEYEHELLMHQDTKYKLMNKQWINPPYKYKKGFWLLTCKTVNE